jgi:predicted flap endonuclease-1-like 5' DNA nuclease
LGEGRKRGNHTSEESSFMGGSHWVFDPRPTGAIYDNEPVTKLRGIAKATKSKLESYGVTTIKDIRKESDELLQQIPSNMDARLRIPKNSS